MTDRPILFSAPMVRALLDGRKTQTRRVVKPQPTEAAKDAGVIHAPGLPSHGQWSWLDDTDIEWSGVVVEEFRAPYGVPGDRLWVRETWGSTQADHPGTPEGRKPQQGDQLVFAADPGATSQWGRGLPSQGGFVWRPSIHMPRWASRLTLTIIDVRVERLQDISEADAVAEAADRLTTDGEGAFYLDAERGSYRMGFAGLWSHINGPDAWAANPWVWALTFTVERRNIDEQQP